jgi:hypothetical protein
VGKIIGDNQCGFWHNRSATNHIFCICQCWRKNGSIVGQYTLFLYFKKVCHSVRQQILYSILTEICMPVKLVRLIRIRLNKTCSKVCIGKILSDAFHVQNSLKQGNFLSSLLFNFALDYIIRKDQNWMEHISSWSMLTMLICWIKIKIPWRKTQKLY